MMANRIVLAFVVFALVPLALPQNAPAGAFVNLNFEQATVVVNDPTFGNLAWNLALPGWAPGVGQPDSSSVYYRSGHLGFAPFIMLLDNTSQSPFPAISGNYSLRIRGSFVPEYGNGAVRQTGDVPAFARAIELLVRGAEPQVFLGNDLIPLVVVSQSGGTVRYAGNIVEHAGTTAELRIAYPPGDGNFDEEGDSYSGNIDDIQFTTRVVVPEPNTCILAALGTIGVIAVRRRRASRRRPQK
jgi:hypothetical protein